ncbi:MAG: hypothetical protein Q9188_002643 [Gyalolechia gomerana]
MAQSTFFNQYPSFRQKQKAPILDEFYRLARKMGWERYTTHWKIQRRECLQAEFAFHFGSIEAGNKLAGWEGLCQELGVSGRLGSITKCKKALKRVHVNILDFIDDRRAGVPTTTFPSAGALAVYTREHKRRFPLDDTEGDSLMKILLKRID